MTGHGTSPFFHRSSVQQDGLEPIIFPIGRERGGRTRSERNVELGRTREAQPAAQPQCSSCRCTCRRVRHGLEQLPAPGEKIAGQQKNFWLVQPVFCKQIRGITANNLPAMAPAVFSPSPLTKESPGWAADKEAPNCTTCQDPFSMMNRKHHCRNCGKVFCIKCCNVHARMPGWSMSARVCEACHLSCARGSRSAPTQKAGSADGLAIEPTAPSAEYQDVAIESTKDGINLRGASNLTLTHCNVSARNIGIAKTGAGTVTMSDCDIAAKEGITIGGSIKLVISNSVIVGEEVGLHAKGSCNVTLEDCHIVCKAGAAIECQGACKVVLVNCTVSGLYGISASGGCEFTIKGGSVASHNTLHPLLLKVPVDMPGKNGATLKLIGPCKVFASGGASVVGNQQVSPVAKVQL